MKHPRHVKHIDEDEGGWIVSLRDGWSFEPQICGIVHVRGFDTLHEVREAIKTKNLWRVKEPK